MLGTPATLFVAPTGEIVERFNGVLNEDQLNTRIEAGVADLATLLPVGYAFAAGMVASANPCGILMLTSYAFRQMRGEREEVSTARRALWGLLVSGVVTLGFVAIFAVVGGTRQI